MNKLSLSITTLLTVFALLVSSVVINPTVVSAATSTLEFTIINLGSGTSQRPSIGDVDNDGDLDIYVPNYGGASNLFINDGSSNFTSTNLGGGLYEASLMIDIDGDTDLDIYVPSWGSGSSALFINDGIGNFTDTPIPGDTGNMMSAAAGDIDSDGDIDIYTVMRYGATNRLWINDGAGNFTSNNFSSTDGQRLDAAFGDVDGDGDLDLYVATIGQNRLWINDGTGSFTGSDIVGDLETSTDVEMGDIDSDGDLDIYVVNTSGAQNRLWINDGTGSFTASDIPGDSGNSASNGATMGDIDSDGDLDIYVVGGSGQNQLWINDGALNFTSETIDGDVTNGGSPLMVDIDNDTDLDIFLARGSANKLFINNPLPTITITAPTKVSNATITNTTFSVTDDRGGSQGILVADVTIDPSTTVMVSNLNCVQTSAVQVDCTLDIDGQGNLVINATDAESGVATATETGYLVDAIPPQVPTVSVNTDAPFDVNNPEVTFAALDNIGIDYYEVDYNLDDGGAGTGTPTTISPATSPVTLVLDPDELTNAPFVHTITIRAYDTVGNVSSNTIKFPPIITFNALTPISNATITNASVTITSPAGNDLTNLVFNAGTTGATLGTCTDDLGGTTDPYADPVTCQINNITTTGTITMSAEDDGTTAIGENMQSFIIEAQDPVISITAPDKTSNTAITTTTLIITDDTAVQPSGVAISAINTTGGFSVSNLSCTQITASRVDCTLQIDGNTGTGDLRVDVTDVAGNTLSATETGYVIDGTPPTTPVQAPDLQAGSDSGTSDTDNLTNQDTPVFDVMCTEIGSTITLYIDGVAEGTEDCTALGTVAISPTSPLADGTYDVTYTETDDFGNESGASPALSITIDTTIATTTINSPTNGNPVTGSAEPNSSVTVTTPSGSTCITTADGGGNYSCALVPAPVDGENVTATATDEFGNSSAAMATAGIDTSAPTTPVIDTVTPGDTIITGTGEISSTIVLTGITCDNDPITITDDGFGNGVWECQNPSPALVAGQTLTATATDAAGNQSIGTYTIALSSSGGGSIRFICKDETATNYNDSRFGRHKQSLCEYDTDQISTTSIPPSETLGSGQCPADLIITQNMRRGARDGQYESYAGEVVDEVVLLQSYINHILAAQYNQAAGPVDGIFGPLTKRGVERLQVVLNDVVQPTSPLVIDGIVGPFTKAAINGFCGE